MAKLNKLKAGQKPTSEDYNKLVDIVNALMNLKGRNGITVKSTPHGTTLVGSVGVASGAVQWAKLTEDATATDNISSNPLSESNGVVDTSTTVTLYATMLNSTRLDMCMPRLSEDDVVPVVKRFFDNEGTPELRWYIDDIFYGSDDFSGTI